MKRFRMAIDASVCFDVLADSEADARDEALRLIDDVWYDGLRVAAADEYDARVYFQEHPDELLTVENVEEVEEGGAT
jgi:hypothetical protein